MSLFFLHLNDIYITLEAISLQFGNLATLKYIEITRHVPACCASSTIQ